METFENHYQSLMDTIRKYVNLRYADPAALYGRIKRSNRK
jgi:hypothetical protein